MMRVVTPLWKGMKMLSGKKKKIKKTVSRCCRVLRRRRLDKPVAIGARTGARPFLLSTEAAATAFARCRRPKSAWWESTIKYPAPDRTDAHSTRSICPDRLPAAATRRIQPHHLPSVTCPSQRSSYFTRSLSPTFLPTRVVAFAPGYPVAERAEHLQQPQVTKPIIRYYKRHQHSIRMR